MKIFISDLDGTLIDNSYYAEKEVSTCISDVLKKGNEFIIATGRTLNGIKALKLNLPIHYIAMNGAIIANKQGEIIYSNNISSEIIEKIHEKYPYDAIEYITTEKTYMTISKQEYINIYSNWDTWVKKMRNKDAFDELLKNYVFNAKLVDFKDLVLKVNVLVLDEKNRDSKIRFFDQLNEIKNASSEVNILEFTNKNISKYSAIKYLIDINNWDELDIYAFGDGDNDCEMLENIHHSYAPCNASIKAKQTAKNIIDDCKNYSVIKEIYNLLR